MVDHPPLSEFEHQEHCTRINQEFDLNSSKVYLRIGWVKSIPWDYGGLGREPLSDQGGTVFSFSLSRSIRSPGEPLYLDKDFGPQEVGGRQFLFFLSTCRSDSLLWDM